MIKPHLILLLVTNSLLWSLTLYTFATSGFTPFSALMAYASVGSIYSVYLISKNPYYLLDVNASPWDVVAMFGLHVVGWVFVLFYVSHVQFILAMTTPEAALRQMGYEARSHD